MAKPVNPNKSPIERAMEDADHDKSLAAEFLEAAELQRLHDLCVQLVDERSKIAKAFDAVMSNWTLLRDNQPVQGQSDKDAIAAIERVATDAIAFSREVVAGLLGQRK